MSGSKEENSKFEARNPKQIRITETEETLTEEAESRSKTNSTRMAGNENSPKSYDLEDRTLQFASAVRGFVKQLPRTIGNDEDARQLVRASGSVGANYIEANESLSKKDFVMRSKISRKEAKESRYWLRLLDTGGDSALENQRTSLIQESTELLNIFGAIVRKSE